MPWTSRTQRHFLRRSFVPLSLWERAGVRVVWCTCGVVLGAKGKAHAQRYLMRGTPGATGVSPGMTPGKPEILRPNTEMEEGKTEILRVFPEMEAGNTDMERGTPEMARGNTEILRGNTEMERANTEMEQGTPEMEEGNTEILRGNTEMVIYRTWRHPRAQAPAWRYYGAVDRRPSATRFYWADAPRRPSADVEKTGRNHASARINTCCG